MKRAKDLRYTPIKQGDKIIDYVSFSRDWNFYGDAKKKKDIVIASHQIIIKQGSTVINNITI